MLAQEMAAAQRAGRFQVQVPADRRNAPAAIGSISMPGESGIPAMNTLAVSPNVSHAPQRTERSPCSPGIPASLEFSGCWTGRLTLTMRT